jgi:hypothetical protein
MLGPTERTRLRASSAVSTLAVLAMLAAASGCGGSAKPTTAVGAMQRWVSELSADYAEQWQTMVPGQQKQIPQATFELCNEEAYVGTNVGNNPPSAAYLSTVAVHGATLPLPGYPTSRTPATLVTAKVQVGKMVSTITLTWFDLDGTWRWALSNAAVASYLGPSCPSVASTGSPYLTPTTTVAPPTTTVPLVAPANVRVQALNGLLVGSLAGELNVKLKTDGYATLAANNATFRVTATSIYVLTPGFVPEADALAQKLGLPTSVVVDTVPPPATAPIPNYILGHADLVVVIGPDLAATLNSG